MRAPIHSVKHYRQMSRTTVATTVTSVESIALTVAIQDVNLENEVAEGSVLKAVYIELWALDSANDGSNVICLVKNAQNEVGLTTAQMNSLFTYDGKKNILFVSQGLSSNNGVGNPINIMRGWYKIPKSKQRFGLGDRLNLCITNNGPNTLEYCGFATYKEYS